MHKTKICLINILCLLLLYSCKTDIPVRSDTAYKAHYQPTFNDVRKAINTSGGATVFVGMDEGVPAVLILNADFSPRFYHKYVEYGPGCFQNVCEMGNGDIAMVGYTQSRNLFASPVNSNPLMIRINARGVFHSFFTDTLSKSNIQGTAITSLENERLLISTYSGVFIGAYRLDENSKQVGQFNKLIWNLNPDSTHHGYISAIAPLHGGSYFYAGNHSLCKNCLAMSIFSFSTYPNSLEPDQNTRQTYKTYYRSGWNNTSLWKPIRGELIPNALSNHYFYGTTNHSDGKYSMLLLNLRTDGGIRNAFSYYGKGQAVFQNIVKFSNGYLLLGSTTEATSSFASMNHDLYIVAIDENGEMLWEDSIVTDNKAESALTAIEKNGVISISGCSIGQNNLSSFFQIAYDLNGSKLN